MNFGYFLVLLTIFGANFVSVYGLQSRDRVISSYNFNISVHVLDTNKGKPATDLPVSLYKLKDDNEWKLVSEGKTAANGRFANFVSTSEDFTASIYKLHFDVKQYYLSMNQKTMYPVIDVIFEVDNVKEHYHIPILLNAFGYTTYRGS